MNFADEFEFLVKEFRHSLSSASQILSPNAEDDTIVKIAIAGFSLSSPIETWARGHFSFLKERLDGDYSTSNLAWYDSAATEIRLFCAFSFGYFLGLYQSDRLTNAEFTMAEELLPGFILLKNEVISGRV